MLYSLWYNDIFLFKFNKLEELEVYLKERNIGYRLLYYKKGKVLVTFVEVRYYIVSSNGRNILNVKENENGK